MLGGNTRSGAEPSLESLSAFLLEDFFLLLTQNNKPINSCNSGVCQARVTGEKNKCVLKHVCDDTWNIAAIPLPTVAWIRKA